MTGKKSDICPENVGSLFTDGKDYFLLTDCETEPHATMCNLKDKDIFVTPLPISQFANFVMLKPVRPIEKPRKPRADKGGTHRVGAATIQPQKETATLEKAASSTVDDVIIHTPVGDETDYVVTVCGCEGRNQRLRLAVMEAVKLWGGNISELSEYGRQQIDAVIGKGNKSKEGN